MARLQGMRVIFAVALVAVVLTHSTVEAQAEGEEAPAEAVKQSGHPPATLSMGCHSDRLWIKSCF